MRFRANTSTGSAAAVSLVTAVVPLVRSYFARTFGGKCRRKSAQHIASVSVQHSPPDTHGALQHDLPGEVEEEIPSSLSVPTTWSPTFSQGTPTARNRKRRGRVYWLSAYNELTAHKPRDLQSSHRTVSQTHEVRLELLLRKLPAVNPARSTNSISSCGACRIWGPSPRRQR